MQAPGGPAPPALGTHRKDAPLGEQLVLPAHIRNNHDVMTFKCARWEPPLPLCGPPPGHQCCCRPRRLPTALSLTLCRPCSKIFASLLAGVFAGIVGITGYQGFIVYLLAHALMGGLLLLKAGLQPQRYFAAP